MYSRDNPSPPDLVQIAGMVSLGMTFVSIVGSLCNEFNLAIANYTYTLFYLFIYLFIASERTDGNGTMLCHAANAEHLI